MKRRIQKLLAVFATALTVLAGNVMPAFAAPQTMADGGIFDAEYYAAQNPDVVAVLGTDANLLYQHYLLAGKAEGRLPYAGANGGAAVVQTGIGAYLTDKSNVQLSMNLAKVPASDDGVLSVYALAPFEYAIPADRAPIAQVALSATPVAKFALPASGLYMKYAFGVTQGGKKVMAGSTQYICNPELLATATKPRVAYPAKAPEGIFANYNIDTRQYSDSFAHGTAKIVQFNNYGTNPALKHPLANAADSHAPWSHDVDKKPFQYMLNAADMNGITTMANIMHEVAAQSTAQDYIIGNEVNVRKWAYIAYVGDEQYIREYMQVFRVAYNAIKSANANARVMICMDQNWDRNHPASYWEHYCVIDVKDFLNSFNTQIQAEGNIDWSIAFHPHPVPLTYAKFWANTANYSSLVTQNKMVTVQNLSTLTNYISQPAFLNPKGQVRGVIATEVGYSANQGADVQGAAIYAAYMAVARNPVVETIVINQDPQPNINSIFTAKAREVFNNMDGANAAAYDAWAKSVIGIRDWGQILK
ncbi:MAG: hypothetical protein IJ600_06780 [Lachnospiraceae bacterium]|nr:hypothetical protein [Lachnospiraceae bacterium]